METEWKHFGSAKRIGVPQVMENIGATRRRRTGDLLITNPSLNSPESRHSKKIREFRDKRRRLLGNFWATCPPAHGLRTDSYSIFRVISHQMFPRKYLT